MDLEISSSDSDSSDMEVLALLAQLSDWDTDSESDADVRHCSSSRRVKRVNCNRASSRRIKRECNNLKRTHKELGRTPAATKSHSRPVIAKVYLYLEKEYEYMKTLNGSNCDLSPLADILKRTADATGVSEEDVITVMESEELSYHLPDRAKRKRRKKNEFIPNESDGNDYLIEDILKEENDDIIDDNLQEEYDDMLEDNLQDENNDIEDNLLEENDDMLEDNLQDENDDIEDNLQEENDDMLEDNLQDENDDMEPNLPEENDDMLDDNLQENDDIEDQRLSEEEVTLDLETTSPGCNVDGVSLEAEDIRVKLEPLNSLTQDPLHPDYSGSCVTSETALPKIKLEPEEDEMEEPKLNQDGQPRTPDPLDTTIKLEPQDYH